MKVNPLTSALTERHNWTEQIS